MVNGSTGSTADHHQGDPFQQDLFQEEKPKELEEEEPVVLCSDLKQHSDPTEKRMNEQQEEEEKQEESSKTPEEEKPKPDALDALYTSLASSEMYNNVSVLIKTQENIVKVINKHTLVIILYCYCRDSNITLC